MIFDSHFMVRGRLRARMLINRVSRRCHPDYGTIIFWRGCPGRGSIWGEAMIATALGLRGFDVRFIFCDSTFSGCIQRTIEDSQPICKWNERCRSCIAYGTKVLKYFGLPYRGISEFILPDRIAELRSIASEMPESNLASFEYRNVPVGEFAKASTFRYFKGKSLDEASSIFREYLFSALVCADAAYCVQEQLSPAHLFMQRHVQYVDWAPAHIVFTQALVSETLWGGAPTQDGRICLKNMQETAWMGLDAMHMSKEAWDRRKDTPLTADQEEAVMSVLERPWINRAWSRDLEVQRPLGPSCPNSILRQLQISGNKPIWCLFAHLTWDAGFSPRRMLFDDVTIWTLKTVEAIAKIYDVTWLVKVHPGEVQGTVHGVEQLLEEQGLSSCPNIRIIPYWSQISTYDLLPVLSGGITIHGSVTFQLPAYGLPVIVSGSPPCGNMGFTYDPHSREEYFQLLRTTPQIGPLSDYQKILARRYAYSLFFESSIPINMSIGRSAYNMIDPKKAHLLFPGNDEVMDMICERIIDGGEFILDDPLGIR